jgi:hypothetical protein
MPAAMVERVRHQQFLVHRLLMLEAEVAVVTIMLLPEPAAPAVVEMVAHLLMPPVRRARQIPAAEVVAVGTTLLPQMAVQAVQAS